MAADDAVSLLRSLKAAGEKTGAVEAEGALHLRRNSRRTMDGIHIDAVAILPGASAVASLPASKFSTPTNTTSMAGGAVAGGVSSPILVPCISFSSNAVPVPSSTSPSGTGTGPSLSLQLGGGGSGSGITLAPASSASGSLPAIASTASSPAHSPSRLTVRPPTPLTSLPSPTGSSPGGGGAAAATATAGSAAAVVPGLGLAPSCGPPSPPCLGAPHGSPGLPRRALHAHSLNGTAYDAVQSPHTHGSPLPLIFDPPVSLPPPSASSPTGGAGSTTLMGGSSPGSPGARQVQLSTAAAAPLSPSAPAASSLPSIASLSGGGGAGGGGLPSPAPPAPMPCLLPPSGYVRTGSARSSFGGTPASLVAAAAGGGAGAGGVGSPLSKSMPTVNSPAGAGSPGSPAGATGAAGGGVRPLRPAPVPVPGGTPFGAPQATPSAAPAPGSPSASPPVPLGVSVQSLRGGTGLTVMSPDPASSSLPLTPSAAQAALQLQLQTAASTSTPPGLPHPALAHHPSRPSSARSVAGGTGGGGGGWCVPEGLSGTLSSRRLSMTGTFESSQKLVLAAAHELSSLQPAHHHQQQQQQHQQQQSQQQQMQMQQMLPPPRLATTSARGPSVSVAGAIGAASGGGASAAAAAALPRVGARDARCSDPGTCGVTAAVAAAAAEPAIEFGFATPEPLPPQPAGRPSLAPLPSGALQAAVRASTPPAAVPSSSTSAGFGPRPLTPNNAPASPQFGLRAALRPEPLQLRPEPPPLPSPVPAAAAALPAVSTSLPEPLQPRQEPLPPLPATAGAAQLPQPATLALAVAAAAQLPGMPLGRAGALAPLALPDEQPTVVGPGPLAESTLDSEMPNLDPAALFRPGSGSDSGFGTGSRGGFMELTVRSMAAKTTAPSGLGGGSDKFAVQSSVRQRLQTDPLRFHPPAAAAGRRPGCLDPLEATPRLVLAGGSAAAAAAGGAVTPPPPRLAFPGLSRGDSAKAGDALWAPSQDILPHMVSRAASGSGGSAAAGTGAGSAGGAGRLAFHAAASPTGGAPAASPLALIPSTPSLEPPTPRLRTNSGGGGGAAGPLLSHPSQQQQQQAGGGLQSSYLRALAAAAGLGDGGAGGFRPLQRQRSLSDSGCGGGGGFLAAVAAAADSGPVGLPLEGGLAVLGGMWSRVRAERHHNTRYNTAATAAADEGAGGGDFDAVLDDTVAFRAAAEAASGMLPLASTSDPRVAGVTAPCTPAPSATSSHEACSSSLQQPPYHHHHHHHHPASPRRNLSGSSITASAASTRLYGNAHERGGAVGATQGSAPLRLDASVSSLPLKALRAAASPTGPTGPPAGGAAATNTAAGPAAGGGGSGAGVGAGAGGVEGASGGGPARMNR